MQNWSLEWTTCLSPLLTASFREQCVQLGCCGCAQSLHSLQRRRDEQEETRELKGAGGMIFWELCQQRRMNSVMTEWTKFRTWQRQGRWDTEAKRHYHPCDVLFYTKAFLIPIIPWCQLPRCYLFLSVLRSQFGEESSLQSVIPSLHRDVVACQC